MPETILVMDEQAEVRLCLSDILSLKGHRVITAESMTSGSELFQKEAPDLVIADLKMPVDACLDLLNAAKGSPSEVDLIVLSAAADQGQAIDWLGKGVFDYLAKPLKERGVVVAAVERALQKRRLIVQNGRLSEALQQCAVKDPLTGLYNDRFMHKCLLDEIVRSSRYGHKFLLMMAEIDHLENLYDSYGTEFGDFVITRMARLLEDNLRLTDSTFRYSGGQFLLLLPETSKSQAIRVAERILESVRYHDFSFEHCKSPVTVSMGAVEFPLEARDVPALIGMAEQRLNGAKAAGRDCFDFEAPISDFSPEI